MESSPSLPDHHPAEAIGRRHADRHLHHLRVVVAAVAADHQRLARKAFERIEDRLDEVLGIMRLLEDRSPSCAGPRCRASGPRRAWWRRLGSWVCSSLQQIAVELRHRRRHCASQETSVSMPRFCMPRHSFGRHSSRAARARACSQRRPRRRARTGSRWQRRPGVPRHWRRSPCRRGRRCAPRRARSRSAGHRAGSGRRARSATARGWCRRPPAADARGPRHSR